MKFLKSFLPSTLWMAFIFFLSSRGRTSITPITLIDFIIFKSLHVIEYGILFFLNYQGLKKSFSLKKERIFLLTLLLTIFYAMIDEIHQTFVPTREGRLRDIGFDSLGAILAGAFLWRFGPNLLWKQKK